MHYKFSVASWGLVCSATASAQAPATEATPPVVSAAFAVVAPDPIPALPWVLAVNRRIQFSGALLKSHYREHDTEGLTPDGVFNTEQGHIMGKGIAVRWQGATPWLPLVPLGLLVEWSYQYLSGQTRYQGYLQQGNTLTPYSAKTGNAYSTWQARLGVPLTGLPAPDQMQWVPYVQYGQQRWQRNLVQYGETYIYQTHSLGVLLQWNVSPRWTAELSYQNGQQRAHLRVDSLAFDADLGNGQPQQTEIAIHYQISERLGLQLQASRTQYRNDQSAVMNRLQGPPSTTLHTQWGTALAWHY